VINGAASTAVDTSETDHCRREAWAVNVGCVAALVEAARRPPLTLVHISSDYVFDGTQALHTELSCFTARCLWAD
jgi:dTDP-4-dehydrorhamnose reductase